MHRDLVSFKAEKKSIFFSHRRRMQNIMYSTVVQIENTNYISTFFLGPWDNFAPWFNVNYFLLDNSSIHNYCIRTLSMVHGEWQSMNISKNVMRYKWHKDCIWQAWRSDKTSKIVLKFKLPKSMDTVVQYKNGEKNIFLINRSAESHRWSVNQPIITERNFRHIQFWHFIAIPSHKNKKETEQWYQPYQNRTVKPHQNPHFPYNAHPRK
jgi:hypothetical protein